MTGPEKMDKPRIRSEVKLKATLLCQALSKALSILNPCVRGSLQPPSGSVIHRKDLLNSEELFHSQFSFRAVKGHRLTTAKVKGI